MKITIVDLSLLKLRTDENALLLQAINDIKMDIVDGHCRTKLIIINDSENQTYEAGWDGAVIGNSHSADIHVNLVLNSNTTIQNVRELYVKYQYGKYWLANSKEHPIQDCYRRLVDGDYELRPEDIIKMGNVEFQVQRFNVAKADDTGTKMFMEDRCAMLQDANVSDF